MSGGQFDYDQYRIGKIADEIDTIIFHNGSSEKDEFGDLRYQTYSRAVIEKFKEAVNALRTAEIYAQRIDWFLSGDDGEDSFFKRLNVDLQKHKPYKIEKD